MKISYRNGSEKMGEMHRNIKRAWFKSVRAGSARNFVLVKDLRLLGNYIKILLLSTLS